MGARRDQAPIRFREDTGWEFRCGDCVKRGVMAFWPLTEEFWDIKRGMQRCRSCQRAADARRGRARYLRNTTHRERRKESARRYYHETRAAQRIRQVERWKEVKADPERHAREMERSRESSRRYRERHAEKAA